VPELYLQENLQCHVLLFKRATAYISINKLVVDGCDLEKGKELHSYLAEDENERKIIVTYVDGKKGNSS